MVGAKLRRGGVEANFEEFRARKGIAMESMIENRIRIDQAAGGRGEVLDRVRSTLSRSCHFTRHWREIACDFEEGILTLRGSVPSFYLKQVLQSILKDVPGVYRIDNRVDVVSAAGLSSVRPH